MSVLQAVDNAVIGGDIIAVMVQQALRQTVLYGAVAGAGVYQPPPIFVAGVPVTARLQEVYQYRAEVTRYAIESAEIASDHIILYPIEIEGTFQVGNWYPGQAEYSLNLLEQVWKARNLLTLITTHKQLQNMVLREFRAENAAPQWGKLDYHAVFQQIPLVTIQTQNSKSQTAATPQTGGSDVSNSANPPVNNGGQTPQAVNNGEASTTGSNTYEAGSNTFSPVG
jgi:hypothetical protein